MRSDHAVHEKRKRRLVNALGKGRLLIPAEVRGARGPTEEGARRCVRVR